MARSLLRTIYSAPIRSGTRMKELNSLKATLQEAQSRVRGGDARTALELLQAAMPVHGESVDLHMNVAIAQRALGNYPAAIESLNAVLAIDPYTFMALLSKGSILEQMGLPRQAAEVYRNALRIAPPDAKLPTGLAAPMQQARAVIARQSEAMAAHFRDALGPILESHEGEALGRFEECLDIVAGTKKVYNAEPVQLHVPQLPAIPFFDRSYFPWLDT